MARSQLVTFDLLMLVLGSAVLLTGAFLQLPRPDDSFHERTYSQRMVLNSLNRTALLLAKYSCEPSAELHDAVVSELNSSLAAANMQDHSYILAANDIRVYSDVADVCLERIGVVRTNLTTPCGEIEVVFGMWRSGEEVRC